MSGQHARPNAEQEHDFHLVMAFQPIMDVVANRTCAYEALVRGPNGEGAPEMLARVTPETRYAFDQQCRVAAIRQAVAAGIMSTGALLSINFLPEAIEDPVADSERTLRTARETGFPPERLTFEFSECKRLDDAHLERVARAYRKMGMTTIIDDFGSGDWGLTLMSRFLPDAVKLQPDLIRGLCGSWARRLVVEETFHLVSRLGVKVIAEGVETRAEYDKLRGIGVRYMQGYYFARPQIGRLVRPELAHAA
ncbi:MAG: EAL domain-containing protein [Sphingomonas sp.]|nr:MULTISPECIES: EAL domain-containing protein [unclassified Sphingomonas]MDR6849516.1 EAL domain-containing protein (putative c-di-GMP-specific phosphodiesterase class I) [Sphingomonas sp. BE137]MDR7259731.1 EAL domain-containing protein (putative c-di-GMP-specific phosphodiesterase class I) [Sphingomonas sp. BE270]